MGHFVIGPLWILVIAGCAAAQPASSPPPPPLVSDASAPATPAVPGPSGGVDAALDRLDALGDSLRDFDADVRLTSEDPAFGNTATRIGKVWYQTKPDGDARIRVGFTARAENDEDPTPDRVEYVLDGGWLTDRNYARKVEVRRQVAKPGERINLLRLGEGPFPLPIGQDKAEVHRLFTVEQVPPTADGRAGDGPAGTTHLRLTPRPTTQFADKFQQIDVWVDDATAMPRRIETIDPRENVNETVLENVRVNPGLNDADFQLGPVDGWDVKTEQYEE